MFRSNNDFNINDKLSAQIDVNIRHAKSTAKTMILLIPCVKMPAIYPAWDDGRLASGKSGSNPYGLLVAGGNSVAHSTQVAGKGSLTFQTCQRVIISGYRISFY